MFYVHSEMLLRFEQTTWEGIEAWGETVLISDRRDENYGKQKP